MMKYFFVICIFLILNKSQANEIDDISLITPKSYEHISKKSESIKSNLQVTIADWANVDIVAEVKKKIDPYKKDLASYFTNAKDFDDFVLNVATIGKNKIIGDNLSETTLTKYYEYLGDELIGGIADKILAKEGIGNPERREMWIKKILTPFHSCINRSKNTLYDASNCLDALSASMAPSAGIGIVYELSRKNLGSSIPEDRKNHFYREQVDVYKDCIKKGSSPNSDIKKCALMAMKKGVQEVTETQLSSTIKQKASSAKSASVIKNSTWPNFKECSEKVGSDTSVTLSLSKQFINCIDKLIQNTGAKLVQDKILHTDSIKSNFSDDEILKLAAGKEQSFLSCSEVQKDKDIRKNGMLDIDACEKKITNDVIYDVVIKILQTSATDNFKNQPEHALKLKAEGKNLLNLCWKDGFTDAARESCLLKTIISFASAIAQIKLDQAVPNSIGNKSEIIKTSLNSFRKCTDEKLPEIISTSSNVSRLTETCSIKLTIEVAKIVARETIKTKALESKLSTAEIEELTNIEVDKNFMKCLGPTPSDNKLNQCTGELKHSASIKLAEKQVRTNAKNKISIEETDKLIKNLVNEQFSNCLGSTPSDSTLDKCIEALTKSATKAIVLGYEKSQIIDQLNTNTAPSSIKKVEDDFISCVDKKHSSEKLSSELDECLKQFSLGFAKTLGQLKVIHSLNSALGSEGVSEQKKAIDQVLSHYYSCLDDLENTPFQNGLLDKLNECTSKLERQSINLVVNSINKWMSGEQVDAISIQVKNEFANFIPCLGAFLPPTPYTPTLEKNVDSLLKISSAVLAKYIEYSPEDAKSTLEAVINRLSGDLRDLASNLNSRKELIDLLYQKGALDQLLKAMVRGKVKDSFDQTSEADLTKDLRDSLLSKQNFDSIFASAEGIKIKEYIMDQILKPLLIEKASMQSPSIQAQMEAVQTQITKLLVYSPNFGDQLIKASIQKKIKDKNAATKFVARLIFGSNSLNWDKVRLTDKGKAAEDFIREKYLMPKFSGIVLSKEEEDKIMKEAEKKVESAIKKYEE